MALMRLKVIMDDKFVRLNEHREKFFSELMDQQQEMLTMIFEDVDLFPTPHEHLLQEFKDTRG